MNKLTCILLTALPMASHAHPGNNGEAWLHALLHSGDALLLSLGLLTIGGWLFYRSRGRS